MVAPELSEEDLKPLSARRTESEAAAVDDVKASIDAHLTGRAKLDDDKVPLGISATRDDHVAQVSLPNAETLTLHTNEPDPAEIDALWHDMDDLNARFKERERSTSRLRLEPTLSSASLEATATGPVGRSHSEPDAASLGIRLMAAAAVLVALLAVGHRFDIPSAGFWEKTDGWVVNQASSAVSRLGEVFTEQ